MTAQILYLASYRKKRRPVAWCKDPYQFTTLGKRPMARNIDPNRLTENEKKVLAFIEQNGETTVLDLKPLFEGNQPLASSVAYTLARKGRVKKVVRRVPADWNGAKHLKPLAFYYPLPGDSA